MTSIEERRAEVAEQQQKMRERELDLIELKGAEPDPFADMSEDFPDLG